MTNKKEIESKSTNEIIDELWDFKGDEDIYRNKEWYSEDDVIKQLKARDKLIKELQEKLKNV